MRACLLPMAPLDAGERLLTPEEAANALHDGQPIKRDTTAADIQRVSICFEGRWRRLARTDWKDDIATASGEYVPHPTQYYRSRIRYGARVGPDFFHVIDALSDG